MNIKPKNLDVCYIFSRTEQAKRHCKDVIESANAIQNDTKKEERLQQAECKACFYLRGRIGGNVMTNVDCSACGKQMHFSNTSVDTVCKDCAKKHNLCKRCGGDIDMKNRRNRVEILRIGSAIGKSESSFDQKRAEIEQKINQGARLTTHRLHLTQE